MEEAAKQIMGFYEEHWPEVQGTALRHPDRNEILFTATYDSQEDMDAFYEARRKNPEWAVVTAPFRRLVSGCEDTIYRIVRGR